MIYGIIPAYVMLYFPEHAMHIMAYVTLFLRRKPSKVNKDKCMSHLRNEERKVELIKGCRRLRDNGTVMHRSYDS